MPYVNIKKVEAHDGCDNHGRPSPRSAPLWAVWKCDICGTYSQRDFDQFKKSAYWKKLPNNTFLRWFLV